MTKKLKDQLIKLGKGKQEQQRIEQERNKNRRTEMNEIETFYGLVENTLDALRIFQMCRDGRLNRVRRRLHDRERRLIRSGSVFVFDEDESGIKRWTDGRLWSPSRILGNFLIYRELEKKQHATNKPKTPIKRSFSQHEQEHQLLLNSKMPRILPKAAESLDMLWGMPKTNQQDGYGDGDGDEEQEDQEINLGINPQELLTNSQRRKVPITPPDSFFDSDPTSGESLRVLKSKKLTNNHKGRYIFKSNGLIKKTISIQLEGHAHHLVAYYSLEDFCRGHLQLNEALESIDDFTTINNLDDNAAAAATTSYNTRSLPFDPQLMEILRQVPIPIDLMLQQNFRKPAALLASATSTAQNLIAGNPENGEKLITALEYGAINPSDLQAGKGSPQILKKSSQGNYVPGGGIIFSSSLLTPEHEQVQKQRPRRHSSFHPPQCRQNKHLIDPLNLLDESSQLSGEALEFLSHFSDENSPDDFEYPSVLSTSQNDLETELFGSILSGSSNSEINLQHQNQMAEFGSVVAHDHNDNPNNNNVPVATVAAIRGQDVLLSDNSN
jgi:hypothetical protein